MEIRQQAMLISQLWSVTPRPDGGHRSLGALGEQHEHEQRQGGDHDRCRDERQGGAETRVMLDEVGAHGQHRGDVGRHQEDHQEADQERASRLGLHEGSEPFGRLDRGPFDVVPQGRDDQQANEYVLDDVAH
jgi:hypothetical protein